LKRVIGAEAFVEILWMQKRAIDFAFLGHKPSDECLIVLLHLLVHEHFTEFRSNFGRLGHQYQSGCRSIQTMHRIEKLLQLISEDLQEHRFGIESAWAAMDDHPGRLENGDEILVLVNDLNRVV
jgi:hypothetical protein